MESVRRAIGSLDESELLMLILTRLEGLSVTETARVLGLEPELAARNLQVAEENLRRWLAAGDDPQATREKAS
jgi:DNA-directed RNA polymerase specialized sigma24 family protein